VVGVNGKGVRRGHWQRHAGHHINGREKFLLQICPKGIAERGEASAASSREGGLHRGGDKDSPVCAQEYSISVIIEGDSSSQRLVISLEVVPADRADGLFQLLGDLYLYHAS
jgi:hypothetical protein